MQHILCCIFYAIKKTRTDLFKQNRLYSITNYELQITNYE